MSVSPTLDEFLKAARQEFDFLRTEFGYSELPVVASPYSVCYGNHDVTILVEGINWGFAVNVLLSSAERQVPLWAIARVRGGAEVAGTQLVQLKGYANLLREIATDVLLGNNAVFHAAADEMVRVFEEAQNKKPGSLPLWF